MIKKADSLKSISEQLYDSYPNVFFDQNYLKFKTQGHDAHYMYLYSESLVIPIIIYKKYIFKYGVFQSEPYMYRETPDDY
mgnify:FL=1